jgi:hypothetical protein
MGVPSAAHLRSTPHQGLHTDEEARVGWVWTAVVAWVLLAAPAAVVLGRTIHRADREERKARPRRPRRP